MKAGRILRPAFDLTASDPRHTAHVDARHDVNALLEHR